MLVETHVAAAVCRVSGGYYGRLMRALGYKPDLINGRGGKRFWGARHILALLVVPGLERLGVDPSNALDVANRIAKGFHSDEMAEAAFAAGRSWLMIVGRVCAPELFTEATIKNTARDQEKALAELGIVVGRLNVAELWEQVRSAAAEAKVQAESEDSYAPAE